MDLTEEDLALLNKLANGVAIDQYAYPVLRAHHIRILTSQRTLARPLTAHYSAARAGKSGHLCCREQFRRS